jgi:DNA-directed RNA polymerase specialized sigma24 family protein
VSVHLETAASLDSAQPRSTLAEFYGATYSRLLAVLVLAVGDRREAEELVQEAFSSRR